MEFKIEITKNGRPNILYGDYKYRESYTLKNGDTVWRCLGRNCGATVKTNAERLLITATNAKHSGPHPVTMRRLSSPRQPHTLSSLPTPVATGTGNQTSCSRVSQLRNEKAMNAPLSPPAPNSAVTDILVSPSLPPPFTAEPSFLEESVQDLEAENLKLKGQVVELSHRLKCVIDHTIVNDTRLMQFTTDIFSASNSPATLPATDITLKTPESAPPSLTECAKQSDLPTACRNEHCAEDRLLINSLRSTIQVLEIEIEHLRAETKLSECGTDGDSGPGPECANRKGPVIDLKTKSQLLLGKISSPEAPCNRCEIYKEETANMIEAIRSLEEQNKWHTIRNHSPILTAAECKYPLNLHNSFAALSGLDDDDCTDFQAMSEITSRQKKVSKSRRGGKFKKGSYDKKNKDINIKGRVKLRYVTIIGDSHSRGLASLVKENIYSQTVVTGVCKPGAGLLDVAPTSTPPGDHCYVLIAGTNDVAVGRQDIIFDHLESVLNTCRESSRVLMMPLPPRYDLPLDSPVHRVISRINLYIGELCRRYKDVEVLDISGLGRQHYTSHGMHLRAGGKRLLAKTIVEQLTKLMPMPHRSALQSVTAASTTQSVLVKNADPCNQRCKIYAEALPRYQRLPPPACLARSRGLVTLRLSPVGGPRPATSPLPGSITLRHETYAEAVTSSGSVQPLHTPDPESRDSPPCIVLPYNSYAEAAKQPLPAEKNSSKPCEKNLCSPAKDKTG